MKIIETKIKGCFIIERDFFKDERGYFSRVMCRKTFEQYGMNVDFVQSNLSGNVNRYTLRGLHAHSAPYCDDKLVVCSHGRIFDVCVDVNPDSPTYRQYVTAELSEDNGKCFYIPKGCAHGFLTLEDDSQVIYYVTHEYTPGKEENYRFDDPAFNIDWGIDDFSKVTISEKDRSHKLIGER